MANKLAGQRAKFTTALAEYQATEDPTRKDRAATKMAEVLHEAPSNGFSEAEVTQGKEVPNEVRDRAQRMPAGDVSQDDPDSLISRLHTLVDASDLVEEGFGTQSVYAYGYRCASDRLKVGRCDSDVLARIASQIGTSTPDKPVLYLLLKTDNARALERIMHGFLELQRQEGGRQR